MAETAVGFVIDQMIQFSTQEVKLLRGVDRQVYEIMLEFDHIKCFLKDADAKAEAAEDHHQHSGHRDGVKIWVNQVRLVAFRIEDVIDEYTLLHLARSRGFTAYLPPKNIVYFFTKLKTRHHIARELQEIKESICSIKDRRERYGIVSLDNGQPTQNPQWHDLREASVFLKEAEVVGIESARDKLIGWLEDESPHRTVIAVVGMGGIGKTTLAKKVHDRVKVQFDCHAWVVVSQSYNKEELLKNLLQNLTGQKRNDEMDRLTLISKIRDVLQDKRYVVFFDDVWKPEFWDDIVLALHNGKGGRIVITTRNMDVANFCKQSSLVHVHELQPLPSQMAWELFCRKLFQRDYEFGGLCPPELENLSHKIVERCQGLPLAIVAVAGLLSTKPKTVDEWRKLHDSFGFELESNPKLMSITRALSLSYNDLPYYIKSCFLYIGMYPEDYPIKCSRLMLQWIAEGFVTPRGNKTVEVVAEEYLTELIHRSLFQVSRASLSGNVKECCIHDLLREMILQKIEELHFGQVLSQSKNSFTEGSRRISLIKPSPFGDLEDRYYSRVRGILFFETYGHGYASFRPECGFHANYKLLKVLDLEGIRVVRISKSIGKLFLLKYFSVANSIVKVIPRSIGELQNLETLNLKNTLVDELPVEINRLHKLRHLLAPKGLKLQEGIGSLTCLQKLYDVNYHYKIGSGDSAADKQMVELRKLTQLRKLGICYLIRGDGESLCECLNEMKHLESLIVASDHHVDDYVDLESLSSPPEFLRRLYLNGRLSKLPGWIIKLKNLVKLEIRLSYLEDNPLEVLQNLHNLLMLSMTWHAYLGERLEFKQGVFPKLKFLNLIDLDKLNSLVIEEGAMPNLEQLFIGNDHFSWQFKEVPSGIQHLRNLKKLVLLYLPDELQRSLKLGGRHYHIVQHVPEVRFRLLPSEFN